MLFRSPVHSFLVKLAHEIAKFDWRVSSTPNLNDEIRRGQMVYKGSSGYKELRIQLVRILCKATDEQIARIANQIRGALKY